MFVSGAHGVELRPVEIEPPENSIGPNWVTWLPGGRTLAFTWVDCLGPGPCRTAIRTVRADRSAPRRLASLPLRFGVFAMRWWP